MKPGPGSPQPQKYTNETPKDEPSPKVPFQKLHGESSQKLPLHWSLGMCLGHPCLAPRELLLLPPPGACGLKTSQGLWEPGESPRTVPCQAETLWPCLQAFCLLGLGAYSLWGLATMESVSSHQEPPGMPHSTEVWPLWRHCQSLACSQPTAGTQGQTELQHFPQEAELTQTGKNVRSNACAQLHTKKENKWPQSGIRKTPKQPWA